jgi:UDP-N-acetylmuramate dehydrogenase
MSALPILENVPLAPLTTLGVGGPARYYLRIERPDDIAAAAEWARSHDQSIFVLGGGSNLVVSDVGFSGLVLHVAVRGISMEEDGDGVVIDVGAGEPWDDVVRTAVERSLTGIESLSGIPGYVGATPIQNVGAYGQEIADTLVSVETVEFSTGHTVTFDSAACDFRYRDSRFKREDRGQHAIVRVRYRLKRNAAPVVRYPEIARALSAAGHREPTLAHVRETVLATRRSKSMVIDPADPCSRSVGSFFVNPVVSTHAAHAAEEALRRQGRLGPAESLPTYPAADGHVKIPAAWLIEHAGLARGTRRGAVGLSENHALAIVNYDRATAENVVAFARAVRDAVRDATGIALVPEPVLVGVSL